MITRYFLSILLIILTMACTAATTRYRVQGFHMASKSFDAIPESPDLNEVVVLEKVTIHIVGQRKHFRWNRAANYDSHIDGYATDQNKIFILGKRLGDKIVVNQVVLGHELHHLLNFKNPEIANPDELNRLEWCSAQKLLGRRC